MDAFRERGLPVVLVNVDRAAPGRTEQARPPQQFPAGWTDLIPELNRQPDDHVVTKRTWGAFTHTDLDTYLKNAGVTQVVIVGISTSAGVESTARQAYEHGFNVTLAVDAMTDRDADVHRQQRHPHIPETGRNGNHSRNPRAAYRRVSGVFRGTFRALRNYNYRVWSIGALISNIGTWMQRTAQDWLVLTQLTRHNATAVGVVMALQFGPHMLMLPWTGFAADHYDRRKLLIVTQLAMGSLALALGILTVTGLVQLWHVYVFAFLLGCASAFDTPARQVFVSDLVGDTDLLNAVALNSTSFNAARMIGPAVAGAVIAAVGTGWSFLANAASFVFVTGSLFALRVDQLHHQPRAVRTKGSLAEGFHYVRGRPDLMAMMLMLFSIGTFGLNFPIFISTMSVTVFHAGASRYGLLSSMMAIGTVVGALLATGREKPDMSLLPWPAPGFSAFGCAAGGDHAELLAVRRRADGYRRGGTDLHQCDEQSGAADDRTHHARPGHGDPPRHRAGRHPNRSPHRRLGQQTISVHAGRWDTSARRRGFGRRDRRGLGYLLKYRNCGAAPTSAGFAVDGADPVAYASSRLRPSVILRNPDIDEIAVGDEGQWLQFADLRLQEVAFE